MKIIPVLDIKKGQVVLAQQGSREHYMPLSTPLCASSKIEDVINAYLTIWPFTHFYIADLDALMSTGDNQTYIAQAFNTFPALQFMIDSGTINKHYLSSYPKQYQPIIGTESINLAALKKTWLQTDDFILSLDFAKDKQLMGEEHLYNSPNLWPKELIIMNLALVGKNKGPDLTKLAKYSQLYPTHNFIAAGGIRDRQDLQLLNKININQALIASALHYQKIDTADLQSLIQ